MSKRRVRDIYPLTAMQQGMLVHALRAPDEPVYQQQYVLAVTGVPDEEPLRAGLADLVARHTVLRTGFVWDGVDTPMQVVFADATVPMEVSDLRTGTPSDVDNRVLEVLAAHRDERFDLRRPPLLRAHAVRVGDAEWRLITMSHHLVLDGWSMPTLQADLAELVSARIAGRPATLAPAAPFREFVTWLRDREPADGTDIAAEAHFKRLLGDLSHPTPLGVDRVSRVSTEAGQSRRLILHRPCAPGRQPDVLARERGLLPSTIAHAAWGLLLAGCAGTPDAVFGTTVSGRPAELPGVTDRVGMFVNTVPVRVAVDGELPVGPWLADLQEQLIACREFEHTPVATAQRCSGVPMGEPLYETVLGFQNYFRDEPAAVAAGDVRVRAVEQLEQTGLPLVVSVALPAGSTWVRIEYDPRRIDRQVAEWLAERYTRLLGDIAAADDQTSLQDISLLGQERVRRIGQRSPARSFAELLDDVDVPGTGTAERLLRDAGVAAGQAFAVALPASSDLLAVVLAGLSIGAEVVPVPADASADELVECVELAGAGVLVVPEGTQLAVQPSVEVVHFGRSGPGTRGKVVAGGRWRGASADTVAEAVDLLSALPLRAGERVAIALSPDEPAFLAVALAALSAGAHIAFHNPVRPGRIDAPVVVGTAAGVVRSEQETVVAVGDPGAVVPGAWRVYGTSATGGVFACVAPESADFGVVPGGRLVDRRGRRVPDAVAGELVVACADGDVPTGVWARVTVDDTVEPLGTMVGSQSTWVERQFAADDAVAQAVVDAGAAWIVPHQETDLDALAGRLRKVVPSYLMPADIHQLTAVALTSTGHVDRAAIAGPGPLTHRPQPRPLAARLATLPSARKAEFLDRLRAAQRATPPVRPGRITGPVPRSVQQEFYDLTAEAALRTWCQAGGDSAPADEHDAQSVATPETGGPLSYADYAAWQTDARRTAERDRQTAHWRDVLRGAPASGIPTDRVARGARVRGERTDTFPVAAGTGEWLAAMATVLARCGRDDDVVLGVVTRPVLAPELAGVRGPFSRMLPVRVAVDPAAGAATVIEAAETALDAARRNADVSWSVLRQLLAQDPLVSVAVHDQPGRLAAHAGTVVGLDIAPDPAGGAGTVITAVFDGTRITERSVADLVRRCVAAVRIGQAEPARPLSAADLVTDAERAELMRHADGGVTDDAPSTVPALVAEHARRAPDSVAVQAVDGALTYHQLLARASALAARLQQLGISVEDRVAVCLPRTSETVWIPLGIMLAGAAYLPIDPKYPEARVSFLCADAGAAAVVTTEELAAKFPDGLPVLTPDALPDNDKEVVAPLPSVRKDAAAYVIYTSGSTGQPKGVVVEHRSVVDFARHIATAYAIDKDTRLLGFAALTFDVSVFDLWSALCAGATLVLAGDEERLSVDKLQRLLAEQRVTAAELPPSLMPLLDPKRLPDLRLVSVGGEAPAGVLVDDWATAQREFWNGYGPAEATVAVTLMRCDPPSGGRIPPIGTPMPNHRAYVLDEQLRPVPVGVPGELCIAGAGLARGYLGRPGQTADRFVPDPFAATPGQRLYRTGDLARWAPDGVLEFLGRVDRQVKIRGFRVELGEVESVLAADDRIRQVAVEVWADGDTRHLTAYVVPTGPAPTLTEVRAIAAARLPDYMTPTRLAVLDALPRTPSGKVDRGALPAPAAPSGATAASDEAWTTLERTIATEVIGPLLRLSDVDRAQDFFELGGNSLQATQVTSRVRDRFGVEVGLADFFVEPTVVRLAQLVEQEQQRAAERAREVYETPRISMDSGTVLPQSFPQMALYQAEQDAGANARYNAPFALRMRGPLDLAALRGAFSSMVRRHPTLRVSLHRDGDQYVQRVLDNCDVPLELSDVEGADLESRLHTVRRLVREEGARGFDLVNGPLIRVRVHRLDVDDHVVQWTVHHLATDGWSVGIQLHEIGSAYHALIDGTEPELQPLDGNYAEFVDWHRNYVDGPQYPKDLDWWRGELRGVPGIGLPTTTDRAGHEFRAGYLNLRIDPELAAAVHALGKQVGTSLYMTTIAAYATVLAAHSGADDIAVVTPNALRVRSAWERLIGWFVNRVVVRLRLDDSASFADLLRATRAVTTAAFVHQAVPFELLRSELALPDDVLAACFSVQNAPMSGRAFRRTEFDMELVGDDSGLDFTPIGEVYAPLRLRYESSVVLRQREDGAVAGGWEYDAGLFDEQTARRWSTGLIAVLGRGAATPEITVRELRRIAVQS